MTDRFPLIWPPARQCLTLAVWAVLFWGGCSSRGQLELLEAEIRQHQDALRQAQSRTTDLESQLATARRETELLRTRMADAGSAVPLPEQTAAISRLAGVKINTLLSGGKDRDGQPGDEVLVALVTPHDEQGDLVKIAGDVEIEAFDLTRTGDDKRVGHWTYSPEQAAQAWHCGFVGAGLQFELPWQELPSAGEILVHARLKTTDGRQFDASTPLKITPPAISAAAAQPVKYEQMETRVNREVESRPALKEAEPVRPVPEYDDPAIPTASSPIPRPFPTATDDPRPAPLPSRESAEGLKTSDSWTDETIPRLR